MTVMEAIRQRHVARAFLNRPIETEKLEQIMEAGRLAPTASNEQNRILIAVTDADLRNQLVDACKGQKFVGEAPAVLIACAYGDRTMVCGQSARSMDCAIAMSFMRLEAVELGLQGCWLGWFESDKVRKILNIPDDYVVVAVMPIGYPIKDGKPSIKKSKEEVIVYNKIYTK